MLTNVVKIIDLDGTNVVKIAKKQGCQTDMTKRSDYN